MVGYVYKQTTVRKQMNSTLEIGQSLTTQKSGVTGEVKEIVKNANGSLRVRLDVNGSDRWTTVK
jgi:preprotein translocase subunit YajC